MTQEDVAKAMGTTQAAIARLESGRSMPSTRTLQRFAEATGTKLRIHFEKPKSTRSAS
jgi:transcriptional regulator with XRE-family HTH domain